MNVLQLEIVHYPAEVLRQKAKPVDVVDEQVKAVAARMIELMREAEGVGLAAPQVGLSWRMFVTVAEKDKRTEPAKVYINPTLKLSGKPEEQEEGCLSIPNVHVEVLRPSTAELIATSLDGEEIRERNSGYMARVWQHEMDHLNGVMIIDKMKPIDRLAMRKTLRDLEASAGGA